MMLRPKPPILLHHPQTRRLLRFSRLQSQSLGLEQLIEHSHSFLARRQSPAQLSVKRAGDLADFVGVGRVSPFWLQILFEKICLWTCSVFVPELGVVFRCAGVGGLDVGCAAMGFEKGGLQDVF